MERTLNRRDPHMTLKRMLHLADELADLAWRRSAPVDPIEIAPLGGPPAYPNLSPAPDARFTMVRLPFTWSSPDSYYWLRLSATCPDWPDDGPVFLRGVLSDLAWNARHPQGIVLVDGVPVGGLDTRHHEARLAAAPTPGQRIDVLVLVWSGMDVTPGPARQLSLGQRDMQTDALSADFATAVRTAEALDIEDYYRWQLLDACEKAAAELDLSRPVGDAFYASVPAARQALADALAKIDLPKNRPSAHLIGHGHLDLGWLWPVQASHFKTLHTVVQQLNLMDDLGDHKFLWSQPQSYQWLMAEHPDTWERVKEKTRSGQWVVQGAMWVEADTNVTGPESLVRQLLYGTRFVREHFGLAERMLWLPDVFGYSAALPQLLREFGIDYFMTTKISWNEYNELPFESFHWRGIDGSSVLTHFGSVREVGTRFITYNANLQPSYLLNGWRRFQSKNVSDRFLVSFGHGDGGGGPDRRQVQFGQRMTDMPGLPRATFRDPTEFFDDLAARGDRLPVWSGELYLEFHRGTYTTDARTKRGNRRSEHALHDAELLATLALPLGGAWDKETLDRCWQRLLLNQFHDILPGSSIQEVYDVAEKEYDWIVGLANEVRDRAAARLASAIDTSAAKAPLLLFNTLDRPRRDSVELPAELTDVDVTLKLADGAAGASQAASDPDGRRYRLADAGELPALGWSVADVAPASKAARSTLTAGADLLENDFWRIELDAGGRITRLTDKRAAREVLAGGALGNALQLLTDQPCQFPAWDVSYHDVDQSGRTLSAERVEVVETGPVRAALRMHYRFGQSRLVQDVRIYAAIARIDFATWCDWHEQDLLLKAAFPVEVFSPRVACEIQFGTVDRPTHRNTPWDLAMFEVPAQRWIDLSEDGYGVSLMNDCKYGHDVRGNVMRVSLLRGASRSRQPKSISDQGENRFCYSLLPHTGDWRGGTIAAAAELNLPALAVGTEPHAGPLAARWSLLSHASPGFHVSTVKKAEDDGRTVIRGYEAHGGRGQVTLRLGRPVKAAWQTRADETNDQPAAVKGDAVTLSVRPFQIVTLKVQWK
ncbi:MAG: hypothetical protein BIFFINMI_04316 [Phycisphaerae bacterium]|nr:hypothetical protein [Phycisphaerae bacterium]